MFFTAKGGGVLGGVEEDAVLRQQPRAARGLLEAATPHISKPVHTLACFNEKWPSFSESLKLEI